MNRKKYILIIILIIIIITGVLLLIFTRDTSFGILKEGKGFSSSEFDMMKMDPRSVEKISDGYIMISNINNNFEESDNDIRITKYDKLFKRLWSYDYIANKTTKKENKHLITYVNKMIEKDNKLFFTIDIWSDATYYDDKSILLILNKNGSLYDEYTFDENIVSMVSVDNEIVTLYGHSQLYEYNYKNRKESTYDMDNFNESSFKILSKNNDEYFVQSSVFYYISEDDQHIAEGTNSIYILDEKFNTKKTLNLDEEIGVKSVDINYEDARMIDERIYVSYFVNGKDEEEYEEIDEDVYGYPGLLVVDKDLNVINNIKYTHEITKKKFKEIADYEIYDYYVYNDELYILIGLDKVLIDKYDKNGKELSSIKTKIPVPKEFEGDSYSSNEYNVIYYDDKKIIYYSIFSGDTENSKKKVYKSILKFAELEL